MLWQYVLFLFLYVFVISSFFSSDIFLKLCWTNGQAANQALKLAHCEGSAKAGRSSERPNESKQIRRMIRI